MARSVREVDLERASEGARRCAHTRSVSSRFNHAGKGVDEFTFVKRGRSLFFVDANFGDKVDPKLVARIRRLVGSVRFEK